MTLRQPLVVRQVPDKLDQVTAVRSLRLRCVGGNEGERRHATTLAAPPQVVRFACDCDAGEWWSGVVVLQGSSFVVRPQPDHDFIRVGTARYVRHEDIVRHVRFAVLASVGVLPSCLDSGQLRELFGVWVDHGVWESFHFVLVLRPTPRRCPTHFVACARDKIGTLASYPLVVAPCICLYLDLTRTVSCEQVTAVAPFR